MKLIETVIKQNSKNCLSDEVFIEDDDVSVSNNFIQAEILQN